MSLPEVTASGYIKGGRLWFHNRPAFDEAVRGMREGWEVEIEVFRFRATRSQKQNAYYHGVVLKCIEARIKEQTGYTSAEIHELMKAKFLSRTDFVANDDGEVIETFVLGRSTRKLTTVQFAEYVDNVRQWAAEKLSLAIDDPDPSWRKGTEPQDEDLEEPGYGAGV